MSSWQFHPLTPDRWSDLERLFGPRGAYGGCWCMWWRRTRTEFQREAGEGNKRALRRLVRGAQVPGLLAYADDQPVGWCSVAPREHFASLNRSRVLRSVDDEAVWSLVCFFIARSHRGQGLAEALARAAVEYVGRQGGRIVEAYPTVPRTKRLAPVSSYMGLPDLLARAGFVEVARPSASRMVMRCYVDPARARSRGSGPKR